MKTCTKLTDEIGYWEDVGTLSSFATNIVSLPISLYNI